MLALSVYTMYHNNNNIVGLHSHEPLFNFFKNLYTCTTVSGAVKQKITLMWVRTNEL